MLNIYYICVWDTECKLSVMIKKITYGASKIELAMDMKQMTIYPKIKACMMRSVISLTLTIYHVSIIIGPTL